MGLIGEGSFGSVYEACDLRGGRNGDRRCALKILHRRQYLAQERLHVHLDIDLIYLTIPFHFVTFMVFNCLIVMLIVVLSAWLETP